MESYEIIEKQLNDLMWQISTMSEGNEFKEACKEKSRLYQQLKQCQKQRD